ncbi:DUF881 domain-containing protein [Ornithinimicrobium panacihumi]|uniref:DUF881 domain-containing protein n=1 Tax=Ornithinimicrobium panacihumi TaxID=2008449 RepID=UPI003F8B74E5
MSTTAPNAPEGTPRRPAGVVGVTVVCVLAGLLFGTSAALARNTPPAAAPLDLVSLIQARDQQVNQLNERVEALRTEVDDLQARAESSQARTASRNADKMAPGVGMAAVSGPAVQVTLDDAGYTLSTLPEGYSVDDVVVHQQDLQAVVNALWAGGAEAIMVQDQRIVSTSSVQCVGNTLYLQGRVYSPPYTITAVGDPNSLHASLQADPTVSIYRQWAEVIGLGYEVNDLATVEVPAFAGGVRPQYATVAEVPEPSEDPTPSPAG